MYYRKQDETEISIMALAQEKLLEIIFKLHWIGMFLY